MGAIPTWCHDLVTRDSGLAIAGQPVDAAIGAVGRAEVLTHLRDELTWALEQADQRYAVLNACRALAYSRDGSVLSKIEGGTWALDHGIDAAMVESSLAAQLGGRDLGRPTPEARAFVERCRAELDFAGAAAHAESAIGGRTPVRRIVGGLP